MSPLARAYALLVEWSKENREDDTNPAKSRESSSERQSQNVNRRFDDTTTPGQQQTEVE